MAELAYLGPALGVHELCCAMLPFRGATPLLQSSNALLGAIAVSCFLPEVS